MSETDSDGCGCTGDVGRAEVDPAYRRALWLVVILNVGFGVAELIGGFIADSQALKADALDFLGDGSITFVGLLALRWAESTRARVALTQGLFLGALNPILGTCSQLHSLGMGGFNLQNGSQVLRECTLELGDGARECAVG